MVLECTTNARAIQRMLTQYGPEAGVDLTAEVLDDAKTVLTFDGPFMDTKVRNVRAYLWYWAKRPLPGLRTIYGDYVGDIVIRRSEFSIPSGVNRSVETAVQGGVRLRASP